MKKQILCGACGALLLAAGCGEARLSTSRDLTASLRMETVETDPRACFPEDFGLSLLANTCDGSKNLVFSPASLATALSMTANGADGETLRQMESVLGADADALNRAAKALSDRMEAGGVRLANAVWADVPDLTLEPAFLQTVKTWYGAPVYEADLQTQEAIDDVNLWVESNTDGLIQKMLTAPRDDTRLYLVNTVLFDQKWAEPYQSDQIHEGTFQLADGTPCQVDFLRSTESTYLENRDFTGFLKPYKGERFSFLGLLPREGLTLDEAARALDGDAYRALLETADRGPMVQTTMPKLRFEWGGEFKDILAALGMEDAFSAAADLSRMGSDTSGPLLLSSVLHKAYLELDEQGTKAAAATIVTADAGAAAPIIERAVALDRPFLFAIVENETGYPLFLGAVANPGAE